MLPRTRLLLTMIALAPGAGCSNESNGTVDRDSEEEESTSREEDEDEADADADDDDGTDDEEGDDSKPSARMDSGMARPTPDAASPDAGSSPRADGGAQPPRADGGMPGLDSGAPSSGTSCLQGSGDYKGEGPYEVQEQDVTIGSKGAYTIFYPDPLEADCPHPIVVWGNGTLITGGTAYDHYHKHAATWGIVTVASHNSNVGDGSFHTEAIDYMLEQNADSSSEFFGKLSTRAGVSGHSQGGAGATRAATHENVAAIVNVQGSFGDPPEGDGALLCLTGTSDIQPTGCPMAVRAAMVPAMSANYDGADHVSTTLLEGTGSEEYTRLSTAWWRCFLADDEGACALFKGGEDCPVCKEPGWAEIFTNNY